MTVVNEDEQPIVPDRNAQDEWTEIEAAWLATQTTPESKQQARKQLTILYLRHWRQWSFADIGAVLGHSAGWIKRLAEAAATKIKEFRQNAAQTVAPGACDPVPDSPL